MTDTDFVAFLVAWFLTAWLLRRWLDRREARRHRRGVARSAPDQEKRRLRHALGLLPPAGDWCGCCGQDCPSGDWWCWACRAHILDGGQPHERTYFAQYGRECPYAIDGFAPLAPGECAIEEVRLMPGADQRDLGDEDQGPEGLGVVRPPRCDRAYPSRVTPWYLLPKAEQDLWYDALWQNHG